jgi:hypothetical protein
MTDSNDILISLAVESADEFATLNWPLSMV